MKNIRQIVIALLIIFPFIFGATRYDLPDVWLMFDREIHIQSDNDVLEFFSQNCDQASLIEDEEKGFQIFFCRRFNNVDIGIQYDLSKKQVRFIMITFYQPEQFINYWEWFHKSVGFFVTLDSNEAYFYYLNKRVMAEFLTREYMILFYAPP